MTRGYDPEAAGALCSQCPLRGNKVVPPCGPVTPEMVIVGEAPGFQEERKGVPFIGASGVLLDEMLKANGIKRSDVLLSNSILCRPVVPEAAGVPDKKRYDVPTYLAWLRKENARRSKEAKKNRSGPPVLLTDPFMNCHPRLMKELHWADHVAKSRGRPNGAVVIALGNKALEMTTGKVGIMKWRGSPLLPLGSEENEHE